MDDIILYKNNLKSSTRNLLEIHTNSAMWQKNRLAPIKVFLYINNKHTEKEIMSIDPFTKASKERKMSGNVTNQGCECILHEKL